LAYAPDAAEHGRGMAHEVNEILDGANLRDIPIYHPTTFEFLDQSRSRQDTRPHHSVTATRLRRRDNRRRRLKVIPV